jgi:type VI secretion system protein VasD
VCARLNDLWNNRVRTVRRKSGALLFAACALLAACHSAPPKLLPPVTKMRITVSADVNPDAQNRPSPIVVRIYQLKDDAAFKDSEFFPLFDKEQATLSASLVSRAEFELATGEQRMFDYQLTPDTAFVAVAAAYRDIRNAQWRAVSAAPDNKPAKVAKTNKITVVVERARVSFAAN